MYKNLYSWGNYDKRLVNFFSLLYLKSIDHYNNTVAKESTLLEQKKDKERIYYFVNCVEKYLFGMIKLGYINSTNKFNMITNIINLPYISVLPKSERGLFGKTLTGSGIEMRPTLDDFTTLKYVSHELGHFMHDEVNWENQYFKIINTLDKDEKNVFSSKVGIKDLYSGFALLDEAIVQDTAENITYYFMKKPRPNKKLSRFDIVGECTTNFGYYGEFQNIAENFSEFIDFSSKGNGDLLKDLAFASYDGSLSEIILNSCNDPKKRNDLVFILKKMGHIKETKYSEIGKFSSVRGENYSNSIQITKDLNNVFSRNKRRIIRIDKPLKHDWTFIPIIKYTLENIKCSEATKDFVENYLQRGINLKLFTKNNINEIVARIINICDYDDIDNNFTLDNIKSFTNKLFLGRNLNMEYKKYLNDMKSKLKSYVNISNLQLNNAIKNLNEYINNIISTMIFTNSTDINNSLDNNLLYYFSLPLRGVGTIDTIYDKNVVLNDLIKRRLNTNFYKGLVDEYSAYVSGHEDLLSDFYNILLIIDKYSRGSEHDKIFYLNEIRKYGNKDLDTRGLINYHVEDFEKRIIRIR